MLWKAFFPKKMISSWLLYKNFYQTISGSQVLLTTPSFSARQAAKSKNSATTRRNGLKVNKICTASCFVWSRVLPIFWRCLKFCPSILSNTHFLKITIFDCLNATPMNEVFILTALLSNNSTKVSSYPMPVHFLLQRHPIKSNKSRKWSLWRKPPLIIQNKFLFFLSNLNSLENGLLTVFNKSWFEKNYSFDVSGLNCWMLWCKTTVTLLCENQTFVKDLKYIFQ